MALLKDLSTRETPHRALDKGVDIRIEHGGKTLLVEVKGVVSGPIRQEAVNQLWNYVHEWSRRGNPVVGLLVAKTDLSDSAMHWLREAQRTGTSLFAVKWQSAADNDALKGKLEQALAAPDQGST